MSDRPEVIMDMDNDSPDMEVDHQIVDQCGSTRPVRSKRKLARYDDYVINEKDF